MKNTITRAALAAFCLLCASCSDAILNQMTEAAATANRPTVSPVNGTSVTAHETITFTFTAAQESSGVSLSGTLGTVAPADLSWSTDKKTLTVNPNVAVLWTAGVDKTLILTVAASGESLPYTFAWDVFNGVCVGDPSVAVASADNGTTLKPYRTIQAGIDAAKTKYVDAGKGNAEVRVGGGAAFVYSAACTVSPAATYVVDMKEGVSVYGGYDAAFDARDTTARVTTIEDTDTAGTGSTATNPVRPVNFGAGITTTTVMDGVTIKLGGSAFIHAGIYCGTSPTMRGVRILGKTSAYGSTAIGILVVNGASPYITQCYINPGSAQSFTYAILATGTSGTHSSLSIVSNELYGGEIKSSNFFGLQLIALTFADAVITGNKLYGGVAPSAAVDYLQNAYATIAIDRSAPRIENNQFLLTNNSSPVIAVFESDDTTSSDPATLRGNDFSYGPSSTESIYCDEAAFSSQYDCITFSNWASIDITTQEGIGKLFNTTWNNFSTSNNINIH
ncbi:MAG: hypothetical protein WCT14_11205 [Treponemataceae bacterium]